MSVVVVSVANMGHGGGVDDGGGVDHRGGVD